MPRRAARDDGDSTSQSLTTTNPAARYRQATGASPQSMTPERRTGGKRARQQRGIWTRPCCSAPLGRRAGVTRQTRCARPRYGSSRRVGSGTAQGPPGRRRCGKAGGRWEPRRPVVHERRQAVAPDRKPTCVCHVQTAPTRRLRPCTHAHLPPECWVSSTLPRPSPP
jgi:hypothetical protein